MKVSSLMVAALCASAAPVFGNITFVANYNDSAMSSAGLSAGQITSVHNAFAFATQQFSNNFTDPITITINVTAVAGTGTLGQSNTFLNSFSYSALQAAIAGDAKTADDATAIGVGGSVPLADPVSGSHQWWVSTAQAKALGLVANNSSVDGTFTFGTGFNYSFDPANRAVAGAFDFIGVAEHEISEIMGRIGGEGTTAINGTPAYLADDLFRYTGSGTRGLTGGGGVSFSINNGATLLKSFNNAIANGGDEQDWGSGTNDSFNAFSSSGVLNDISAVDLRFMDVMGYDGTVPEPATLTLIGAGLALLGFVKFRSRRPAQ